MKADKRVSRCEISEVGKSRNGTSRWWCTRHKAPATGRYGIRLEQCESAHLDVDNLDIFHLDPEEFSGGIGIWGALEPIYNTTGRNERPGVHVHARKTKYGPKEIDKTFDAVSITSRTDLFTNREITITKEVAIAYYVTQYLGYEVKSLFCVKCGEVHLDEGYFATHPHKKHLCHACGKYFHDSEKGISNPVALFRTLSESFQQERNLVPSNRSLSILQADYPGGIQIWASNPALVWTAERSEEEGIHVHAFKEAGNCPSIDETYGSVEIDGISLEYKHVAQYMAQSALPHVRQKVVSLACPTCGTYHFDSGIHGVTPHKLHRCESCETEFSSPGKKKLVVSNPILEKFSVLYDSQNRN